MTSTIMFGDQVITYDENFWSGKKTITINGQKLQKVDKKTYKYKDKYYTLKGSYLTGVELGIGVQKVMLVRKLSTLETILCFLPLLIVVTGGMIGGLCGGAAWAFNAVFIRKHDKMIGKILCSVLSTIAAFVVYLIISVVFLGLIG